VAFSIFFGVVGGTAGGRVIVSEAVLPPVGATVKGAAGLRRTEARTQVRHSSANKTGNSLRAYTYQYDNIHEL